MYNIYLDCFNSKGFGIVYNTNSGTVIAIRNKSMWDNLITSTEINTKSADTDIFKDNKIIVKSHEEELREVKSRYEKGTLNSDYLYITIMPTEACNFSCPYCFIWEKKPRTMQKETYDNILLYIKKSITKNPGIKSIVVNWFGGEPTLCLTQIISFMSDLLCIADEYRTTVISSLTTNGYLLTKSNFLALVKAGITSFQVTVDGTKETHNIGRPHRVDPNSYDVIMDNLAGIHSLDCDFKLDIRCNFTRKTIQSVYDFIQLFSEEFGADSRFNIYCRPVYEYNTKDNTIESMRDDILTIEEGIIQQNLFAQRIADIKGKLPQRRLVDPLPQPTLFWCNAESQNHIIVGADGKLYICDTMTDDSHSIGVLKNGDVVKNNEAAIQYNIFDDTRTEKCIKCKLLPICMGGCLRNRMTDEAQCYWTLSGIEKAIKKYYG